MYTFLLTVNGKEVAEIRAPRRDAIKWARWMLDAGEVGVLTGADFEKEVTG